MGHRSGGAFRRASPRELGVLALGIVLVVTGVSVSTCGSLGDLTRGMSAVEVAERDEQA